ncbi:MAG: type IV toxin-antitoxin system AbiEi family antitoxin [Bacteroidia bacterium]
MAENSIQKAALSQFREATGMTLRKEPGNPDGVVLEVGGLEWVFRILVRNELREHHLGGLLEEIGREQERTLLVTQYVSKPLRERLRKSGVRYLDASGNCYIRAGHSVLFVDERKVSAQRRSGLSGLWKPTGLRFLFTVLLKPDILTADYRSMAIASRLSLGTVAGLMQELERSPYFQKIDGKWEVNDRDSLLERWVDHYHSHLRPRLRQSRYRFAPELWRRQWTQLDVGGSSWGGEPAGALLTQNLQPEHFTLFSDRSASELARQFHLVPDAAGEVEVLQPFWNTDYLPAGLLHTAPVLLVYADLWGSSDSRNRSIAKQIREDYGV